MTRAYATLIIVLLAFSQLSVAATEQVQLLNELSHVPSYTRKSEKTILLVQTQFKYGLNPNSGSGGYGRGRWLDRPLLIDPRPETPHKGPLALWDFTTMIANMKKSGFDGFSFFPDASTRFHYFDYLQEANDTNIIVLTKLTYLDLATLAKKKLALEKALASPQSLRINGRVVIETYGPKAEDLASWVDVVENFRTQYKDKFLFLIDPQIPVRSITEQYLAGSLTKASAEQLRLSLTPFLRVSDGLVVSGYFDVTRNGVRVVDTDIFQAFFLPVMNSLYTEKEFQHKLLGIHCFAGHANANRLGYSKSHEGTSTFRKTVQSAIAAQPDFLVVAEWDEQDENTAIRPTVYNSTSYLRIMRFLSNELNQRKQEPLPNDDLNKPNLIVSYRKSLMLGEELTVELLNVPDSTEATTYACHVFLKDREGKIVQEFPAVTFNSAVLSSHRLKLACETLAAEHVVLPSVVIEYKGKRVLCEDGLHYIALNPTWNWDYVWVKQPVREIFTPAALALDIAKQAEGVVKVSAEIKADQTLHFAEVLDNDNVIFVAGDAGAPNWREDGNQFTLLFRMDTIESQDVSGSIAIEGAGGKIAITRRHIPEVTDQVLKFKAWNLLSWSQAVYLTIAKQDVDKAVVHIDFPGILQKKITFRQIIDNHIYCAAGPRGIMFSLHRFTGQDSYPGRNQTNHLTFSALRVPDHRNSIIHMRAQNEAGQLYFSKPFLNNTNRNEDKVPIRIYSNSRGQPIRLQLEKSRVFDCSYLIAPQHYGDAFICDYGRAMWAVGGMSIANVSLRGDQEGANNGMPLPVWTGMLPSDYDKTAPESVKDETGEWAWQFDGKDDFVTFPIGFIPRMSAFTLSFQIKPENIQGKQFIIGNRAHYPASLYEVYIKNGILYASYIDINVKSKTFSSNLKVPEKTWSELKISYDQENLQFEINGEKSEKIACPGPGLFDMVSCLGGHKNAWFAGLIKNVSISHALSP